MLLVSELERRHSRNVIYFVHRALWLYRWVRRPAGTLRHHVYLCTARRDLDACCSSNREKCTCEKQNIMVIKNWGVYCLYMCFLRKYISKATCVSVIKNVVISLLQSCIALPLILFISIKISCSCYFIDSYILF